MNDDGAQPRRYGVLIASSQFPDEPKLNDLSCPENDVDGLFAILNDEAIGGFSELLVVKNQASYAVLRNVHQVLRKAGRNDLVLIYYAGHGKLDRAGRLHLATLDTVNDELESTSVPAQRVRDLIDNADTGKAVLILDCCYSGAIEKSFLRGEVEEQLNIMAGGRGTYIMTASTDVQTAREEVRDGYGIFTKHVIDGIRGGADVDGDGVVTMNELYSYVHRHVMAESHQVPMKWNLNVQGDVVIAQTGRKPREERRRAIRERIFALADEGSIPDLVLTKAIEVSNLAFEDTRSGAAARYDALLDRLLEPDLRVGRFLDDWLQVVPDAPAPEPVPELEPVKPEPRRPEAEPPPRDDVAEGWQEAPAPEPARPTAGLFWKLLVFPYPAIQENLDRHPLYRLIHGRQIRAREFAQVAAGQKLSVNRRDIVICAAWVMLGFPFMILMSQIYQDANISYFHPTEPWRSDEPSGAITGALAWAAFGWILRKRASHRLNALIKLFYWLGFGALLVLAGAILINV